MPASGRARMTRPYMFLKESPTASLLLSEIRDRLATKWYLSYLGSVRAIDMA
jgi:hypothetical protein